MNILTYLRVSTEDQTLDPQRIELAAWASRQGWSVVAEYSDVLSGTKAARPGLDAMVARCKGGDVDAVVVVKLDRLGRSLINVVRLVRELAALHVAVICTSQGIDTRESSPCGKMIMGVMAAFAEFERDLIAERTRAGLRAAVARGKVLGKPSLTLVGAEGRGPVVLAWRAEGRPGGVRGLAVRLGGCSPTTAARVDRETAVLVED